MAELDIRGDEVAVRFTPAETVAGLRRGTTFRRSNIVDVTVFDDGLDATRGIRAPGLAIPGRRRIGTWRRRHGKELVSVKRGVPAVRVTLENERYAAVVVAVDDPARARAALTGAA
jgi:hypothetical protein